MNFFAKHSNISLLIPVIIMWVTAVSFAATNAQEKIELSNALTRSIFSGSSQLNFTILTYTSNRDISDAVIVSDCQVETSFLSKRNNAYSFLAEYWDTDCWVDDVYLQDSLWDIIDGSQLDVEVWSDFELYNRFPDYSNQDLEIILKNLSQKQQKVSLYANYAPVTWVNNLDGYAKKASYLQYEYNMRIIENILWYRQHKYLVPVAWHELPTRETKLPNSWRPYREAYTDGIHHSWDIDGVKWEESQALDSGIIVRVVDGFVWADFDRLKLTWDISEADEINNLDILRWNQVWLKTMKWDLVFYSHLDDVFVETGDIVEVGDRIGTLGSTGVPDRNYVDFHLHFPIHKNPYDRALAGSYNFQDYMRWPWYFKWESVHTIRAQQGDIFE